MRRREFAAGLSVAILVPRAARAQQVNIPVIGMVLSAEGSIARNPAGYRRGLADLGFSDGRDFRFENKNPHFQFDRIADLVRELVDQKAALVVAASTAQLAAAKRATTSVPIVFTIGSDPVENGFVQSLNTPGGNATGVFTLGILLSGKRLHLLREMLPSVEKFAFLTNPNSPNVDEAETREIRTAATAAGVNLVILKARSPDEFESAFQSAVREGAGGLIVSLEGIFTGNPDKLALLARQYRLPSIYSDDEPTRVGGLISYGGDQDDSFRLVGVYAARILKGEKPANMPVHQSTKTKLVINLKTAMDLGIAVPPMLLSRADEVIE